MERIIIKLNENSSKVLTSIKEKAFMAEISFSYQEMEILKLLLKQKGNPVTRDIFIKLLSNKKLPANKTRVIDVHISNIKKKLKILNININISSIRGIGYTLSE